MRSILLFTTLLCSSYLFSFSSLASSKINVSYEFYDIYPSQVNSISKELDLKSKTYANGKRYRAEAQWEVQLDYKWKKSKQQCKITKVATTLNVNYVMPQLFSNSVKPEVKERFNKYYQALMHHEEGHKNTGFQAAKELALLIRNMPSMSSCEKLEQRVYEKSQLVLLKYQKIDQQYDKFTSHGHRQGAHI